MKFYISLFLPILILASCNNRKDQVFHLLDPEDSGISFTNTITESDSINILDLEYVYNGGGVAIADYNNDGKKDLFVTNGYGRDMINRDFIKFYANERLKHLQGNTDDKMFGLLQSIKSTPLQNFIFENEGGFFFKDRTVDWGLTGADYAHGAAYADLDKDGDLDLIFNRMNAAAGIYKNNNIEAAVGNREKE